MMRRKSVQFAASAVAGVMAFSAAGQAWAQQASTSAGSASRPRSTDERVNTEMATPPPVNSDYRRAAEGTLPLVPGGTTPITGRGGEDPAVRPLIGSGALAGRASNAGVGVGLPVGLDVAMLIEHAVGMAIDSAMIGGFAEANSPDAEGNDAVKAMLAHSQDEMRDSKDLLTKAAAAGNSIDANSPIRKLYGAASNYMITLGALCTPGTLTSANDKAQVATINHAVKSVMDAGHIQQFAGGPAAAPALGALVAHAQAMKDDGMKSLDQLAGTAPVDPAAAPSTMLLAQRGRDLISSFNGVGPIGRGGFAGINSNGNGAMGALINGQGPNPGRLQDTRPEIIGGTYGTGSPTAGTATGAEAARNVQNSTEGPNGELNVPTPNGAPGSGTSSYGVGNNNTPPTQSTAGSRPR